MTVIGAKFIRYMVGDDSRHVFLGLGPLLDSPFITMDIEKAYQFPQHHKAVEAREKYAELFKDRVVEVLPVVIDYDFSVPPSYPRDAYKG